MLDHLQFFYVPVELEGPQLATACIATSSCQVESINNSPGSVFLLLQPGVRFALLAKRVHFGLICSLASVVTPEVVFGGIATQSVPSALVYGDTLPQEYSCTGLPFVWTIGVFSVSSLP